MRGLILGWSAVRTSRRSDRRSAAPTVTRPRHPHMCAGLQFADVAHGASEAFVAHQAFECIESAALVAQLGQIEQAVDRLVTFTADTLDRVAVFASCFQMVALHRSPDAFAKWAGHDGENRCPGVAARL